MRTSICDQLGIEYPVLAFSHCRDVVAAVTRAGGFGVLGATTLTPEQLEIELRWIDEAVGGQPYGVDVLVPEKLAGMERGSGLRRRRPGRADPRGAPPVPRPLLAEYGIEPVPPGGDGEPVSRPARASPPGSDGRGRRSGSSRWLSTTRSGSWPTLWARRRRR